MLFSIYLDIFFFFNDSSKIIFEGTVNESLQIFSIVIDTLSYPCDLLKATDFILIIYLKFQKLSHVQPDLDILFGKLVS